MDENKNLRDFFLMPHWFTKVRTLYTVECGLLACYTLLLVGFYLAPDWKAVNILFYFLIVFPFLLFRSKQIIEIAIKNSSMVLGNITIIYFSVSHFWVTGEPVFETTKVVGMGLCTLLFFNISYYAVKTEYPRVFMPAIVLSAAVMTVYSLAFFYENVPFPQTRFQSAINPVHPILIAQLLGLAFLFALQQVITTRHAAWRYFCCICLGVFFLSIMLTHSRSVILSLGFTITFFLFFMRWRLSLTILFVIIAVLFTYWYFDHTAFSKLISRGLNGREAIWTALLERLPGHWVLGLGISADDNAAFESGYISEHPHSLFFGLVYYGGVLGGIVCSLFLISILRLSASLELLKQHWHVYGLIVFGLSSLLVEGEKIVQLPSTEWLLFWLPCAYIIATLDKQPLKRHARTATDGE